MPNIMLSQDAINALNTIYKVHSANPSSSYKTFHVNLLFHEDTNDIMPALIELSRNKLIRIFSDKRLMLREEAIAYLENSTPNNTFHQATFAT